MVQVVTNDWRLRARCRPGNSEGIDPELFFPVSEVGLGAEQVARAKAVCADCPVRAECWQACMDLQDALASHRFGGGQTVSGIWAGTTESERRALRRDALKEAAG